MRVLLAVWNSCIHELLADLCDGAARMLDSLLNVFHLAVDNSLRCDNRVELSLKSLLVALVVVLHAKSQLDELGGSFAWLFCANSLVVLLARVDHSDQHLLRQWWQTLGVGAQTLESISLSLARAEQVGVISWVGKVRESVRESLL